MARDVLQHQLIRSLVALLKTWEDILSRMNQMRFEPAAAIPENSRNSVSTTWSGTTWR
jgi:hypothetical protein